MDKEKKIEQLLKFIYYILGLNVTSFAFVAIIISRNEDYWIDKIKRKMIRKIVGFLGSSTGITIASIIFWISLFKGYITI